MTRDTYAREVIRAAEAAFYRNERPICPHEGCQEQLSVVRQTNFSTRSLFCPVHGHIFQEQSLDARSKLDWDGAAERFSEIEDVDEELDEDDEG